MELFSIYIHLYHGNIFRLLTLLAFMEKNKWKEPQHMYLGY